MARAIAFFPKQVFMGTTAAAVAHVSEIFEITEEGRIDFECRVYALYSAVTITGSLETTSDPTFLDASWKQLAGSSFLRSSSGITVQTGISGLGRFVRAKIEVPTSGIVCARLDAVARAL